MSNLAEQLSKDRIQRKLDNLQRKRKDRNRGVMQKILLGTGIGILAVLFIWSWISGIWTYNSPTAPAWVFTTGIIAFFGAIVAYIILIGVAYTLNAGVAIAVGIIAILQFTFSGVWSSADVSESGFVYKYDEDTATVTVVGVNSSDAELEFDTDKLGLNVKTLIIAKGAVKNSSAESVSFINDGGVLVEKGAFSGVFIDRITIDGNGVGFTSEAVKDSTVGVLEVTADNITFEKEAINNSFVDEFTVKGAAVTTEKKAFSYDTFKNVTFDGCTVPVGADALASGVKSIFDRCTGLNLTLIGGTEISYLSDDLDSLTLGGTSEVRLACYYMNMGASDQVKVGTLILLRDYDGEIINYYNTGMFKENVHAIASANKIYIPRDVTELSEYFFGDNGEGCKVYYEGTADEWNAITIPTEGNSNYHEKNFIDIEYNASCDAWE